MGNNDTEIIKEYKYLGVVFSSTGSFLNAHKHIAEQAKKAMYLLFMRINNFNLPLDLQLNFLTILLCRYCAMHQKYLDLKI